MSLGLVLRDITLASDNKINATPTLFINGRRILGVRDANQLRQLIAQAKGEATQPKVADAIVSHR
jgi:protein-disulfide isomerase